MATRHQRYAPIGEYQPLAITAAGTLVPVGACVNTTGGAIAGAGSQTVTPGSMNNIAPGMFLNIAGGTGTAENVQVVSVTSTTFTAVFAGAHSGGYSITSLRGTFLHGLIVNQPGSSDVRITLYNGSPSASPAGAAFAIIDPTLGKPPYFYDCVLDKGLFYTVAGTTIGNYTLLSLDMGT